MKTTMVQLKKITAEKLKMLKTYERQSYDEIINRLMQQLEEPLTNEEIRDIQEGLEDVKSERVKSIEKVASDYGVKLK
jgi:hypothetical protein